MESDEVGKLSFREFAHIVGICDAIFSCLTFIGNFILAVNLGASYGLHSLVFGTSLSGDGPSPLGPKEKMFMDIVNYIWSSSVADCVITIVQLYLAILLINAASIGRTAKNAINRVIPYLGYNGAVLLAYFIWRIVDKSWATFIISGLMRLTALIIVGMYLMQLMEIAKRNRSGNGKGRITATDNINGDLVKVNNLKATATRTYN